MTKVIKVGANASMVVIKSLSLATSVDHDLAPPPSPLEIELQCAQAALDELKAEILTRERAAEALRAEIDRAFHRGRAEGLVEGEALAMDRSGAALELLQRSLQNAQNGLSAKLATIEGLAVVLTQTALEKVFGDASQFKDVMRDVIARQITLIGPHLVLGVIVSRVDFPDQTALDALAASLNHPHLSLAYDANLTSGDCRLKLELGQLDIGLCQQWSALKDVFNAIIEERIN